MRDLDIFEHEDKDQERVVTRVGDKENWQTVKETLLKNVGLATIPMIKVVDADFDHSRVLYLWHRYNGCYLDLGYAENTIGYVHPLWGRKVLLETILDEKDCLLTYGDDGFSKQQRT